MPELKWELNIEAKDSVKLLDKFDKLIEAIDKGLLNLGNVADNSFAGISKSASNSSKKISDLLSQLNFLKKEYTEISKLQDSPQKTTQLTALKEEYRKTTEELNKYGNGIKTIVEAQQKLSSQQLFKENLKDITRTSDGVSQLNQYYKNLEKTSAKTAIEQEKLLTIQSKLSSLPLPKLLEFQPKNIKEASAAIQELKNRREGLNKSDSNYIKTLGDINTRQAVLINQNKQAASTGLQLKNTVDRTNSSMLEQSRVMSQIRNQFLTYFSIYEAQRFLREMIKIRGEFELQQVALSAMLQNRKLAAELFEDVQALALQSPFRILELNKYVKQLKAYRIENNDLIGTLKQLGDISAGLGVSLDRLILAYGQVRAASVLRGQELRQFTEAGIPLVDALADKFSELEDRVVGTDEIFEKISKRQVSFELIKEIFGDMTREGGIFFDQQKKQAETLSGQVSILRDAFDKMLNSLGKANEGTFKGGIKAVRSLLDNYELVLSVIKSLIITYGVYKTALIVTNLLEKNKAYWLTKIIALQNLLNKTLLKNPYILAATAIAALVTGLITLYKAQKKISSEATLNADISKRLADNFELERSKLELLNRAYKKAEGNSNERKKILSEINNIYPDLLKNMRNEEVSMIELNKLTDDYIKKLESKLKLQILEDKIGENRAEKLKAESQLNLGEISLNDYNKIYNRTKEQNDLLLQQIDYQRDLVAYGKEYADLVKERDSLKISEGISDLASKIDESLKSRDEFLKWQKEINDIALETGGFQPDNRTYEEYLIEFNKDINIRENQAKRLAEIEKRIQEIINGTQVSFLEWQKQVNKIVKEAGKIPDIKIFEVTKPFQTGLSYIEKLQEEYSGVIQKIEKLSKVRDKDVSEEKKALQQRLDLIKELAKVFPAELEQKKPDADLLKSQKNQLKYLEEVRQFYVQLRDITKGTTLGTEERLKTGVEEIFKGNKEYAKALESFTDESFRAALEGLITQARKIGGNSADAFIAGLNDKLTNIDQDIKIDDTKFKVEIEKLRDKLLGEQSPFGEDLIFDITIETTRALNDISKIESEYNKAQIGASENQKNILEDLKKREIQKIQDVEKERIKALAGNALKNQLGNLEQFYTNINEATLKNIRQVDKAVDEIANKKVEPINLISPEDLTRLNLTKEQVFALLEIMKKGENIKGLINEDQEKILKNAINAANTYNLKIEELISSWEELSSETKEGIILDIVSELSSAFGDLSNSISEFGNAIKNTDLEEFGEQLYNISRLIEDVINVASAKDPLEEITSIISLISTLISNISKGIQRNIDVLDTWNEKLEQTAQNMKISRIEAELLNKEVNLFGTENPYNEAVSGVDALKVANEELKKLALSLGNAYIQTGTKISSTYEDSGNKLKDVFGALFNFVSGKGLLEIEPVFESLAEKFGEIFDPVTFELNQEILDSYNQLDEETQKLIDNWDEIANKAEEAKNQIVSSIEGLVGGMASDWSDVLVDGFVNASDAADGLKKSTEDIVETLFQQVLTASLLKPAFDALQKDIFASFGLDENGNIKNDTGPEADQSITDDIGRWFQAFDIPGLTKEVNASLSSFQDEMKKFGLDVFTPETGEEIKKGLSGAISGITEDTANILAAYLNTIRSEVIISNQYSSQLLFVARNTQGIISQQLTNLIAINNNAKRTADILEAAANGTRPLNVS